MNKMNFTFLLSVLFLLNLSFSVNANVETRDYVPRNVNIDRSNLPKNILFGTFFGGRSHNKPMLDIGAILIERGYNVVLATSGDYTPSSEYPTAKQISLGPKLDLKNIKNAAEFVNKGFDFTTIQDLVLKSYNNTFEKYKNTAKDYNIDLFVCYALMNDACIDAANALKKPVVGFGAFLHALEPKSYKSDPVFSCNISLENESFLERFRCTVLKPIQMIYYFMSFTNQLNDIRKQINVEPNFMSASRLSKTSLILVDTFFGFELPQSLPPNIQEIGPILSDEYPPLSPKLSDFMVRHKRVLYIAFGARYFSYFTTIEMNNKLLQSFIEAINKNIIDGVIWSLVQISKDNFSPALSLTDGTQIQTSPILNNEHPHIHIATNFAPQFAILNHTNTKLFLSHGGAGSSHESLYTGTPMLILPFAGDQMGNAEKLKVSGIALTLNKHDLDVIDIINKVDSLLKDENVKKNVKRLEVLAKINSKRKYRAADLIEYTLHSSSFNESLKEWIPADTRMGIIRGNNYDVLGALLVINLGFIGGIVWFTLKSIRFIVRKIPSFANSKPKRE